MQQLFLVPLYFSKFSSYLQPLLHGLLGNYVELHLGLLHGALDDGVVLVDVGLADKMHRLLALPKPHLDEDVLDLSLLREFLEQAQQGLLVHLGRVALLDLVLLDQLEQLGGVINHLMKKNDKGVFLT